MMQEFQTPEDEFRHYLREFHDLFHSKQNTAYLYTAEVVKICNAALSTANIRHIPVTSRVKSWESAKGSVIRRQQERLFWQRVYPRVTTREPVWVEYCRRRRLEQRDFRPFKSAKEMIEGLHDIGGVRISLYFPGDVANVVGVLQKRFHVLRVTEKGQDQSDARYLKDFLDDLDRDGTDKHPITIKKPGGYEPTFGGYKATHLIVKLREADIPENKKCTWNDTVVEIQLGTLVMHMWSEIEHDMIYKPLESQGDEISEDEKRVLDLINGIIMTGEAALRQLEVSTARRLTQRAKDREAFASSPYELVLWIENYYKDKGKPLSDGEWELLDQLYAILQVNGDHQHGKVEELLDRIQVSAAPSRQELLEMILEALCANPVLCQPSPEDESAGVEEQTIAQARFWGMRLLQSLNMAIYLGVGEQFVDPSVIEPIPLSLGTFLDIVHPYSPYRVDVTCAIHITAYCKSIINQNRARDRLQKVSVDLPQTGRLFHPTSAYETRSVLVPGMLIKLFRDETNIDFSVLVGFIHDYIDRNNIDDDKIVLWDRLTSASQIQARWKPIDQRVLVSQAPPWEGKGVWKLEDLAAEGEVTKWDGFAGEKSLASIQLSPEEGGVKLSAVGLACRLFSENQWADVKRAWTLADILGEMTQVRMKRDSGEKFISDPSQRYDI